MKRKLFAGVVIALSAASVAFAAWMTAGSGTANAMSSLMPTGAQPTATVPVSGDDVTVSWGESLIGSTPVQGYIVKRYDTASVAQTVLSDCSGTVTALTCIENNVPDGLWQYTVTPKQSSWIGTEGTKSLAVAVVTAPVDITPPDAPEFTGSTPASPSNDQSPDINGTAEADSAISLYTDEDCTSVVAGTGTTTSGGSFSVSVTAAANDSTTYWGKAKDAADNTSTCSTSSFTYVHDDVSPTVVSINRTDANPSNASTVNYLVTFSESVTGVDTDGSDFSLSPTVTGASISSVSGSGASRTVAVATGTGSGSLRLNLVDDDSISDAAANKLGGDGTLNGNLTGETYTIDKVGPTVASINRSGANPTNSSTVNYTVTFSESVTGVGSDGSDFSLATTGVTGASINSVTGSGTSRTVAVDTGTGNGTIGLNLVDDDSIVDGLGNKLGGTDPGNGNFTGQVYDVDKTAPVVQSINRADPDPTNATSINFTVTFSEPVTGVDTNGSDFSLSPTVTGAVIESVSGTAATRTVVVNTGTGSGSLGLNLVDDDSILDAATNKLGGTGINTGNFSGQTYTVDKIVPTVVSINRADSNPTNAATVNFTATFSESVTGVDTTDFVLATTGVSGASISNVTGSGATRNIAVNTGSGSGSVGLNLTDDDTILDAATNKLGSSGHNNGNFTGQVYTIDKVAPTVSSINRATPAGATTNASSVTFTATFSESVSGVDATDFALATTGVTGASITNVTGSGTTRSVTVDTGTGDGTVGLNLVDDNSIIDVGGNPLAGAGNGNFTGQVYTIDKTAPTVTSINRTTPASATTNASSVTFTATFSEAVTGVNSGDFALATSGVTGASITSVSTPDTGTTRTITVNTGSGSGSVGLNLVDNNSIVDGATNPLGGAGGIANGDFTGEVYTIDKVAPTVSSIDRTTPASATTNASSVTYTATFSESVTGVDTTDFSLSPTVTGASITSVSGSGTTRSIVVNTGTGSGSLGLNIVDNNSIIDSAGNPLGGAGGINNGDFTGQTYTIDKVAPSVSSINRTTPAAATTNASSVTFTATFSESVSGVDETDFALATTGVTGASITSVTGSGTTRSIVVNTGSGDGSVGLNLVDDNSITDDTGNALGGAGAITNGDFTGQVYTIDKTAPTVSSINRTTPASSTTNASSVTFTATFSESVNGVDTTDFAIPPTGLSGASITSVTGSGNTRSIVVNTGTGAGSLGLNLVDDNSIVDAATNPLGGAGGIANGDFTGETYTVDKAVPMVTSIDRTTPAAATTNASSVTYTATFSESVSNVDTVDFSLSPTVTGASITSVTGSGSTRSVVVNTGTGSGSLGLNLVDDDSIVDGAGNKLGGTGINNGNFTGQTYTIDKVAPSVLSSNRTTPATAATNASSVTFTATFSESVTGVDSTDLSLATTGVSGAFITSVSADTGSTRTVVVNTGSGSGTIRLDIGDNDSIVDGIGNPLGGPGNANGHFITGEVYTIDKTAPTITNMTLANVGGGNTVGRLDANDTATIVFSEDLIPQSMCSGTPNSGSATSGNLLLDANGDSVVVKVTNGVSGANDVLTIDSVSTSRCSSGFNFGSIDLGNGGFVGANTTYSGTGTNGRSEIRWTSSSKTLIIELGTPSVGGSAVTASVTAVYTPDVDITDFGTNPISGNFSKAATQF